MCTRGDRATGVAGCPRGWSVAGLPRHAGRPSDADHPDVGVEPFNNPEGHGVSGLAVGGGAGRGPPLEEPRLRPAPSGAAPQRSARLGVKPGIRYASRHSRGRRGSNVIHERSRVPPVPHARFPLCNDDAHPLTKHTNHPHKGTKSQYLDDYSGGEFVLFNPLITSSPERFGETVLFLSCRLQ